MHLDMHLDMHFDMHFDMLRVWITCQHPMLPHPQQYMLSGSDCDSFRRAGGGCVCSALAGAVLHACPIHDSFQADSLCVDTVQVSFVLFVKAHMALTV